PVRAAGRMALPFRHAAVLRAQQPQVRLRQCVSERPLRRGDHRVGQGWAGVIRRGVEEVGPGVRWGGHEIPLDFEMSGDDYGNCSTVMSGKLANWLSLVRKTSQPDSIAAARWSASGRL